MDTSFDTAGTSQQSTSGEYLTPRWVLDPLGPFDLDPCASIVRPWPTAKEHYTITDDGLLKPWVGRVWCNPPYGRASGSTFEGFLKKMSAHENGILLVFARTETKIFQHYVFGWASALLFLAGRVPFCDTTGQVVKDKHGKDGSPGSPSVLVAYDLFAESRNADCLRDCGLKGAFISLRP